MTRLSSKSVAEARPETLKLQTLKLCSAKSSRVPRSTEESFRKKTGGGPAGGSIDLLNKIYRTCCPQYFEAYSDAVCVEIPAKIRPKD
jgi:hypothetical protein